MRRSSSRAVATGATSRPASRRQVLAIAFTTAGFFVLDWRLGLAGLATIPFYAMGLRWYLPRSGPFYRADVPEMEAGANISQDDRGVPLGVRGTVLDLDGAPLAGALVEVWQANAEGRYENQEPDRQPENNLRGRFRTDARELHHFVGQLRQLIHRE